MNGPTEAAGFAFFKLYGFKAGMGMLGAAFLYLIFPPKKSDGTFDQREFIARLAAAGFCSMVFGDWAVDVIHGKWSWLLVDTHRAPIYLIVGAPAWWIGRAVAVWFQKRRDKDIGELAQDAKEIAK